MYFVCFLFVPGGRTACCLALSLGALLLNCGCDISRTAIRKTCFASAYRGLGVLFHVHARLLSRCVMCVVVSWLPLTALTSRLVVVVVVAAVVIAVRLVVRS